jgi:elongator complex protein 4
MRKRLIFETLHLDVEGGVGERRTTHSANAIALDAGITHPAGSEILQGQPEMAVASIEVQFETAEQGRPSTSASLQGGKASPTLKVKKSKKKVAFQSDRPDLYDF